MLTIKKEDDDGYKGTIKAESIAHAVAFAIEQAADVAINELLVRLPSSGL